MEPEPLKHGPGEISTLLVRLQDGDRTVEDQLFAAVHSELRKIARRYMRDERPGHTLQATALVNEAYVKLVKQRRPDWKNRAHFFAIASRVMRRILVDHAKARLAGKRGGGNRPLSLDEELLIPDERCQQLSDLDDALRLLERENPRVGRVVELRFFVGLSVEETAEALKVSPRTVKRDWEYGRTWLRAELSRPYGSRGRPAGKD